MTGKPDSSENQEGMENFLAELPTPLLGPNHCPAFEGTGNLSHILYLTYSPVEGGRLQVGGVEGECPPVNVKAQ